MPYAAKRPCNHPGCGLLIQHGERYCEPHRKANQTRVESRRGSSNERGYTGAWQKARVGWLRAHPLCTTHAERGQTVAGNVVDHKVPHRGDKVLFWDSANWQTLCKACHDRKTATEDGGFGR